MPPLTDAALPPGWRWQALFPGGLPVLTNTPEGHEYCTGCGAFVRLATWGSNVGLCVPCFSRSQLPRTLLYHSTHRESINARRRARHKERTHATVS